MACICIKKYTSVPTDDYFFLIPIYGAHWPPLKPWASWASLSSPGPPPGPFWELRIKKKNSRDIHVSHAQNTVNYRVFGGFWGVGAKNTVIYSVFAPADRVDYATPHELILAHFL